VLSCCADGRLNRRSKRRVVREEVVGRKEGDDRIRVMLQDSKERHDDGHRTLDLRSERLAEGSAMEHRSTIDIREFSSSG